MFLIFANSWLLGFIGLLLLVTASIVKVWNHWNFRYFNGCFDIHVLFGLVVFTGGMIRRITGKVKIAIFDALYLWLGLRVFNVGLLDFKAHFDRFLFFWNNGIYFYFLCNRINDSSSMIWWSLSLVCHFSGLFFWVILHLSCFFLSTNWWINC